MNVHHFAVVACVLLGVVCGSNSPLSAQPGPLPGEANTGEALREQIRALEEQLRTIEQRDLGKRRVTTIGSSRGESGRRGLSIRVYDISDLFTIAPPYAAQHTSDLHPGQGPIFSNSAFNAAAATTSGGFGGGGGFGGAGGGAGFFRVPVDRLQSDHSPPAQKSTTAPRTAVHQSPEVLHQLGLEMVRSAVQTTVESLIVAIQQTISPELWSEGDGAITRLGSNLLIVADEDTHRQIDDLLNLFRKRWGTLRTVSVRAWWTWLTDGELTALLADPHQPVAANGPQAFGLVKPDAWQEHLENRRQNENAPAGWQAAVTGYNGQTFHVLSGGQRAFVTNVQPVISEHQTAYQPQTNVLQEGAVLQVTPVTNTTGQTVLLDVHSRVCLLRETIEPKLKEVVAKQLAAGSPADVVSVLERPEVLLHRLSTTLRVPVDVPILVGGMNFDSRPKKGEPNLYLFVQLHVQELRNNEEEEILPTLPPAAAEPKR